MDDLLNSVLSPNTVVSLITSAFAFFSSYKLLEQRVKNLEKEVKDINSEEIKITLAQIQSDISWIKMELQKKN